MGKKYIVELGRCERLCKAYINGNGKPNLTWLSPEVDLTPYTEPDLEQVRKEAYLKGLNDGQGVILESTQNNAFNNGYKKCLEDMDQVRKEAYQQGLSDAEEGKATCQYCEYQYLDDTEEPCKECCKAYMNKYKPKAKEEQIIKGDIVLIKSTPEVEILVTYADEEYVSGIALTEVDDNCEIGDQYTNIRISNVKKTGKHYDIVSVLQKMREESNG